jgi:hypothetical protein
MMPLRRNDLRGKAKEVGVREVGVSQGSGDDGSGTAQAVRYSVSEGVVKNFFCGVSFSCEPEGLRPAAFMVRLWDHHVSEA